MKRVLIFLGLFFCGVFVPWQATTILVALYAAYFLFSAELAFYGLFLDGAFVDRVPSLFTLGFLAIIISSEFLKSFIKAEGCFGKAVVAAVSLAFFAAVYFLIK